MSDMHSYKDLVLTIEQWLMTNYWGPLYKALKADPRLLETFPGFLLRPEKRIYYLGRHHIGIEYIGPERLATFSKGGIVEAQVIDYSLKDCNLLEEIVGFDYGKGTITLPLASITEDLVLPTNAGADELQRLNWNWSAQSMIVGFNASCVEAPIGQFTRLINARFFDATPQGGLKTRHIKWLDLIPCKYDDSGNTVDKFSVWIDPFIKLAEVDVHATYPVPSDFRLARLQMMNRFVEFIGDKNNDEPAITRFLASEDLRFALKMRFSAKEVFPECLCEWQSADRKPIKPDFFVVGPDGYADIVEFKLPEIDGSTVVGSENRETFSAAINSYVSQTRVYREYFDDPNNRAYVKAKYGFDVYKPRRHLIIGRRWHFTNSDWRAIAAEFTDLTIHTYDDLIDGVVMQFYD
ncbi:MAG: hypothetical protein NTZ51_08635 [Proteobacteria bacterium]|nr:hypothetical protein [Pseudomonadota bacterium]